LINAEIERSGDLLSLSARIEVMQEINNSTKNLYFGYTTFQDSVHAAFARALEIHDFIITQPGEIIEIQHDFNVNSIYTDEMLHGYLFIQDPETKKMYQGKDVIIYNQLSADFTSNLQQGPGILTVEFENLSTPELSADSYEWDLDGDGTIDSTERNPVFQYDQVGSYDVKLVMTKGAETVEITKVDYIMVTDGSNISGTISGIWEESGNPYIITGNVEIKEESELSLLPSTKVICQAGEFVIKGKITALGTNTEPVIFEGEASWDGIKINSRWLSEFDYCRFYGSEDSAVIVENSVISLTNSIFWGNSGQSFAASVELDNCNDFLLTGNLISGNYNSMYCGGIGFTNSNGTVSNNIIVNNTGGPAGVIALKEDSDVMLINNTIVNNQGSSTIFVHSSDLTCMNSIIQSDSNIFMNISSGISAEYCILSEDYNGTGNLNTDPLFINPTTEVGSTSSYLAANWDLSQDSPCIDAGNPAEEYNDLDGSINDIGAYGWNSFPLTTSAELTINFTSNENLTGALVTLSAISGEVWEETISSSNSLFWEEILTSKYDVIVNLNGDEYTSSIEFYENSEFDIEAIFTGSSSEMISPVLLDLTNYPNPFNPDTTISFNTTENTELLKLIIYNLKGQKIRVLLQAAVSAGNHSVKWDGKNDAGKEVSSGIYLYKLDVGLNHKTQKMILLK
jgi:PKD repeat protein